MSPYLIKQKPLLKELIDRLSQEFGYASVLSVDTKGKTYFVQRTGVSINDSSWGERGFVVRVHNGINYSEYSFNELTKDSVNSIADNIIAKFKKDLSLDNRNAYPVIKEESVVKSFLGEVKILPESVNAQEKIGKMAAIKEKALKYCEELIDFRVSYEEVQISKIFISSNKELEQAYIWSQGALVPIVRRDKNTKYTYKSFSGLKAVELLEEMEEFVEETVKEALELLDADTVKPGEYEVICTPEIAGLIAHEAFGHGVEMDMFVKKRAKAPEYMGKDVASAIVDMHDGAASAVNISSYLFDDEGTLGTDTVIIKNGILTNGISDILSALKLGTMPTGNGKRQSFERKAYARMTNTFFAPGQDKLEDMIASIKFGYLLDGTMSGMEDPKNWGIQCVILTGKEIVDGKLTGKIVSPLIMTGYVPDLLKSISMVSEQVKLSGSGACGKGHKEWVKVSDGGPYIKAKARLG